MMTRPSWDEYFMDIARKAATRGTCDRKQVGCLLVHDRRIIATGYNGSISGTAHCDDIDHDMVESHCVRTIHAEANAVADAARRGVSLLGSTAYVTALPCWNCFKLLVQAGIKRVVYDEPYRATDELAKRVFEAAYRLAIPLEHADGTADNGCEHGDHAAPPGWRFCCEACADCEGEPAPEGKCCAGLCGRKQEEY